MGVFRKEQGEEEIWGGMPANAIVIGCTVGGRQAESWG